MILGREEILKRVKNENLIENFCEQCLQQAGYDLRIKTAYYIEGSPSLLKEKRILPNVTEIKTEKIVLEPNEYVLIETVEKVNMPLDLIALVFPRTTLFRMGASLRTGVVDPGYKGTLTFGLKNESDLRIKIEKGARVAQIIFIKTIGKTVEYKGKYQGGKVI